MSYNVNVTKNFSSEAKSLFKKYNSAKNDVRALISELENNPKLGISVGKGFFKIRLAIKSKGKGKSGGVRVITYYYKENESVYLISIYDKSEFDSVNMERIIKIFSNEGL
jgi:mRNA-degrading endonuclease RelE of RelBE toxin-antitoxin system